MADSFVLVLNCAMGLLSDSANEPSLFALCAARQRTQRLTAKEELIYEVAK